MIQIFFVNGNETERHNLAEVYINTAIAIIKDDWCNTHGTIADMSWVDNWVKSLYKVHKSPTTDECYDDNDVLRILSKYIIEEHPKIETMDSKNFLDTSLLDDIFCQEVLHTAYATVTPTSFTKNMTDEEVEFADNIVSELDYSELMNIYHEDNDAISRVRDKIDHQAMQVFNRCILDNSPYLRMSFSDFAEDFGKAMNASKMKFVDFCDADPNGEDANGRWYRYSHEFINGRFRFAISGLCDDYDRINMSTDYHNIDKGMFADVASFHDRKTALQTDAYGDYYVWVEKDTAKNFGILD